MRYDANNKRYVTLCNSSTIEPLFFKSHNQILTIIFFLPIALFIIIIVYYASLHVQFLLHHFVCFLNRLNCSDQCVQTKGYI